MIFAVADDATVHVLDDIAHVRRECEAADVESETWTFYAEDGTWLRAQFTQPPPRGLLGWLSGKSGWFELIRDPNLGRAVDPFEVALSECVNVEPNAHFATTTDILAFVESRRASTTPPL